MNNLYLLQQLKFLSLVAVSIAAGLFLYERPVSADTTIDDFTAAGNDRFTNDTSAFVFPSSFSLSGVGRTNDNGRWATLISDNVFLSASHFRPSVGSTVEFYPGNDPTASPFLANVTGGSQVISADGSTDLYVGYLDRIVDPSIDRYTFATTFINGTAASPGSVFIDPNNPFQNDLGYIVGISSTSRSDIVIDHSIGLNRVSGYGENVEFQGNTNNDTLIYEYNGRNDPTYETNEAYVRGGDSGAPNFTIQNNQLLLLGVNSFQLNGNPVTIVDPLTGDTTTEQFRATGITYTGNQADEISRLISVAPTVSAVPEPSSAIILAMFSLFALRRYRN